MMAVSHASRYSCPVVGISGSVQGDYFCVSLVCVKAQLLLAENLRFNTSTSRVVRGMEADLQYQVQPPDA